MRHFSTFILLASVFGLSFSLNASPSTDSAEKSSWSCKLEKSNEDAVLVDLTVMEPLPTLEIVENGKYCLSFPTVQWNEKKDFKTLTIQCDRLTYKAYVDKAWNLTELRSLLDQRGYYNIYSCEKI
jgi:hypothetical protein